MSRDITLTGTTHALFGDETYEIWLKHESGPWALEQVGDVTVDSGEPQDFLLQGLTEGDHYVAQARMKRNGRYRAGYLTSNPDTWPAQSRVAFVPGALEGVGAPTISSAVWSRTSDSSTRITLGIVLADGTKSTKVYRDGDLVTTLDPGVTGFVDLDPELAVLHVYTARHTDEDLDGPFSAPVECFAGPSAPDFALASAVDTFGYYNVTYDASGDPVEIEDDFACNSVFVDVLPVSPTTTNPFTRQIEDHETAIGDPQHVIFHSRCRRQHTSFTVMDRSDWTTILVECDIEPDNTEYNSCP